MTESVRPSDRMWVCASCGDPHFAMEDLVAHLSAVHGYRRVSLDLERLVGWSCFVTPAAVVMGDAVPVRLAETRPSFTLPRKKPTRLPR